MFILNLLIDGRLYKSIKTNFEFENYLLLPKFLRISISKIRLSSHVFFIERGRWLKIKRDERKCSMCQTIEDEYHIFIECPRFSKVRKDYLPSLLKDRPSMFNFVTFLKSKDESQQKQLGYLSYKMLKDYKAELFVT